MILLVTNRRDLTTDFIVRELKARETEFFRLNTDDFARYEIVFIPNRASYRISYNGSSLDLADVKAAYYRRPEPPLVEGVKADDVNYVQAEWQAALKSIYVLIADRWLNHPASISIAEDKPSQLRAALAEGLMIPRTAITNVAAEVLEFTRDFPSIGKPLRQALVVDGAGKESVVFTSRIAPRLDDADSISLCPMILQEEIEKQFDIRVTVIGDKAYAVGIASQTRADTITDWRKGSHPDLPHEVIELPDHIAAACIGVVARLKLRFGAIDLILDREGNYWFLECNPNGQWAWLENRTGVGLSAAIVDELENIGNRPKGR